MFGQDQFCRLRLALWLRHELLSRNRRERGKQLGTSPNAAPYDTTPYDVISVRAAIKPRGDQYSSFPHKVEGHEQARTANTRIAQCKCKIGRCAMCQDATAAERMAKMFKSRTTGRHGVKARRMLELPEPNWSGSSHVVADEHAQSRTARQYRASGDRPER